MATTAPKQTAPKFVAPPKPATVPTSLDQADYGYKDAKGQFRFWQGYDAAFKSALMKASRDPSTNGNTRKKAINTLVERGWSTEEKEAAYLADRKAKIQAAVDRMKAKAEKAAAKKNGAKAEAPAEPETEEVTSEDVTADEDVEPETDEA